MSDLEKLERLEQSITQLLYEVDSNFSKCHRIITTNILPIVEKYAENSGDVWEHSKFWKQFFEASANVSLSGYEEQADQDLGDTTHTRREDSTFFDGTQSRQTPRQSQQQKGTGESPFDLTGEDDQISSPAPGSRMQTETPLTQRMESLEISSSPGNAPTPQTQLRQHNGHSHLNSDTPSSSPMYQSAIDRLNATATPMTAPRSKNKNPLLHRVLDSNWKVQATPHSTRARTSKNDHMLDHSTSPTSSPPELTTQLGASLRTSRGQKTPKQGKGAYYDSDDESSIGQMSPPVTMAFSLPPSKLLRTPAKEAARHMVDEILRTAGANDLSTIPSETPADPLDGRGHGNGTESFAQGTQTQNESRRLFGVGQNEETPIVRKAGGVLDNWQESGEGSNWL